MWVSQGRSAMVTPNCKENEFPQKLCKDAFQQEQGEVKAVYTCSSFNWNAKLCAVFVV
jgi:hypothetical protein